MPSSQFALMEATKKRAAKLEAKGQPVDFKALLKMEPDSGTTNIRNVASKHWKRWLGPEYRCLVPFTSFSEFNKSAGGNIWFALGDSRPLACFAGIWTSWTSVRKGKEGETANDVDAFLTTEPKGSAAKTAPAKGKKPTKLPSGQRELLLPISGKRAAEAELLPLECFCPDMPR
jgi:putative SOS response-associated peptidase YedK